MCERERLLQTSLPLFSFLFFSWRERRASERIYRKVLLVKLLCNERTLINAPSGAGGCCCCVHPSVRVSSTIANPVFEGARSFAEARVYGMYSIDNEGRERGLS